MHREEQVKETQLDRVEGTVEGLKELEGSKMGASAYQVHSLPSLGLQTSKMLTKGK